MKPKNHWSNNPEKALEVKTKLSKHNARYWKGKKMPKEVGIKISAKKKGWKPPFTQEWKDKVSKALTGHRPWNKGMKHSESTKKTLREAHKKTNERIITELKEFERQGFRCVPTGGKVRPDFIAIKDNKVFAVEVEYGRPNYPKYTDDVKSYFDDVIWILCKETPTTTIRTLGKEKI